MIVVLFVLVVGVAWVMRPPRDPEREADELRRRIKREIDKRLAHSTGREASSSTAKQSRA